MSGWQEKNKKGGKIKEEGIRGRETVVLFSLVWHYLSLLINPLRPPRGDQTKTEGGRGWLHVQRHEHVEGCLLVGEGITLHGATNRPVFYLHVWVSLNAAGCTVPPIF